jgi:FkbM family methyltransferase
MFATPTTFADFEQALRRLCAERSAQRIADDLRGGAWVHGAGDYGRHLARLLDEAGFTVEGFIDRRAGPSFAEIDGRPVVHPDVLSADRARGRAFVGGVMNPNASSREMLAWAAGLPFAAHVLGADVPELLGPVANAIWQGSRGEMLRNIEALVAFAARLADAKSLEVLLGLLSWRVASGAVHPGYQAADQYLPRDLPGFDGPITFVDGGAFTGDTCRHLIERGVAVRRYVAFEPDLANLGRLSAFTREAPAMESLILPCGLGGRFADLAFVEGQGPCSRLAGVGEPGTSIRVAALDDLLPTLAPDFLKLDVEGAELAALRGAERAIARGRPRLAVALYHAPADLWEIPAWVGERYDTLHLRQHGRNAVETVLYAMP